MSFRLVLLSCFVVAGFAQYHNQPSQPLPAQYPAGVDPKSCPNYPDCSNPLVAVQTADKAQQYNAEPQYQTQQFPAQPQYQQSQYQQPQYQQPQQYQQSQQYQQPQQYQPQHTQVAQPQQYQQPAPVAPAQSQYSPDVQQRLDRGEYIGDGDYHGEGLSESLAPGFSAPREYSAARASQTASAQYYQPQPTAPAYSPAPQAPQQYSFQYNPTAQSPQAPLFNPVSPSQYPEPAQLQDSRAYSPVSNVLNSSPAAPAQIPAGVDPNACPNYPFCHS